MNDFVKGGAIILLWLGIFYVIENAIPKPISGPMPWIIAVGSFIASIVIVNFLDKYLKGQKSDNSYVSYPENWEELRTQVLVRDGYRCGNCGSTDKLQIHHIVPLSRGARINSQI